MTQRGCPSFASLSATLIVLFGVAACSAVDQPSCRNSTATEKLRRGLEQDILGLGHYGPAIQVATVEVSPVEQLRTGVVCRALVEVSGVDLGNMQMGGGPAVSRIVTPFQIRIAYRVDLVDGELVTRWDASNLFQVVGMAATFKAAQDAGVGLPGYAPRTPGR